MIVELEVNYKNEKEKVYLSWVRLSENIKHVVRDIKDARVYSKSQAMKLKKKFANQNARLIKCKSN